MISFLSFYNLKFVPETRGFGFGLNIDLYVYVTLILVASN